MSDTEGQLEAASGRFAHHVEPRTTTGPVDATAATAPEALVARMAERDEAALSELYDRFSERVYALIVRILGDEADAGDVLLDVFTRAWWKAGEYDRAKSTVSTWLCVTARSKAIDLLRARRSRLANVEKALGATPYHPLAMGHGPRPLTVDAETLEMRRRIGQALDALSADQRRAIELAYFEGLSQSEIADRLQAPLGTIKTRIRTGMIRLRALLEPLYANGAG